MANKRELAGIQLLRKKISIMRVDQSTFSVCSQSDPNKRYEIKWSRNRWVCPCKDFEKHDKKCKHIYALDYYLMLNEMNTASENFSPRPTCPKCGSNQHVTKRGFRYKRQGAEQRYYCASCEFRFVNESAFKWMRTKSRAIASALDLYFRGLSLRQVQQHLEDSYGIKVTHTTIYNWLRKYVTIVSQFLEDAQATTSERWLADETLVRIKGRYTVLWNLLDSETRLHIAMQISSRRDIANAQTLLRKGTEKTIKRPLEIVTDGLQSYDKAIETELQNPNSYSHQGIIHLQGPLSEALNNKVERFQGTIKARLKTTYHLENERTAETFFKGFSTHYNYVKRHKALKEKTPAQAAKLARDKSTWLSLIQQAGESKRASPFSQKAKRKTD
jgi:transposase-like protein